MAKNFIKKQNVSKSKYCLAGVDLEFSWGQFSKKIASDVKPIFKVDKILSKAHDFLRAIIDAKVFKHIKFSVNHINHRCIDASQKVNFIVELPVRKSFGVFKISVDFVQVVFDWQKITTQYSKQDLLWSKFVMKNKFLKKNPTVYWLKISIKNEMWVKVSTAWQGWI